MHHIDDSSLSLQLNYAPSKLKRGSAISEEPHISDTLHWRLSKLINCSWTNEPFWNIHLTKYRDLETRVRGHSRSLVIKPSERCSNPAWDLSER